MADGLKAHRVLTLRELWADDLDSDGGFCLGSHDDKPAWYARTPNGLVANLHSHTVTEHKDGTITVKEHIVVANSLGMSWRGTLVKGKWKPLDDEG